MTGLVATGVLLLQGALLLSVYVGYRRENVAAAINAAVAVGATLLPLAVARVFRLTGTQRAAFGSVLTLWIAVAGFLHVLGMFGLYEHDPTWWWDHLTHTVSAALVGALVYAVVLVWTSTGGAVSLLVSVGTLVGTLSLGVAWEGVELVARALGERYDIEPVLVHYGRRDTLFDLVFDAVGAALVLALDLRLFVPLAEALLATL